MFNRTALNMFMIGGVISSLAFGFSLFSTTKINPPLTYLPRKFSETIGKVSDIEDLEYANGCKFFFYDKERTSESQLEISDARRFKVQDTKKEEFFKAVETEKDKCSKDRIIYIKH